MQNVVVTTELTGSLNSNQILRLLNNTDDRRISAFVHTNSARINIGDIAAYRAIMEVSFNIHKGFGEIRYVLFFHSKDMEGKSPCCFGANSGQARKGVNQFS